MPVTIITKNNASAGVVPSAGQLVQGELAVNVVDKRLYTLDALGNVVLISSGADYNVPVTIDVNSASAAVRITQRGSGYSLLVEDSTNPDSTPFAVDATGNVGIGTTSITEKLTIAGNTSLSGNLVFTSTGNRITGDFSNATVANRVAFQNSVTNGATNLQAIPNGTSSIAGYVAYNNSDPTNASIAQLRAQSDQVVVNSGITGTGTYLPMTFSTFGSEKLRIAADATGTYTFGGTAPRITGDFSNATIANRVAFQSSTTNSQTALIALPNGTSVISGIAFFDNSDPTNAAFGQIRTQGASDVRLVSGITGTGTYLPMTFYTGGSEAVRIETSQRLIVQKASNGALTALTSSAGSIAVDLNLANNFTHTTTENTTLANPTNMTAGQYGVIVITQGATPRTMAFGSYWDFSNGGVPSLTATASAVDVIAFYVASTTKIIANFLQDVK
jgi:hypothetical protein